MLSPRADSLIALSSGGAGEVGDHLGIGFGGEAHEDPAGVGRIGFADH